MSSPAATPSRRRGTAQVALLVVLVLLGAALAWWGWRGGAVAPRATDTAVSTAPAGPTPVAQTARPADDAARTTASRRTGRPEGDAAQQTTAGGPHTVPGEGEAAAAPDVASGPVHLTIARGADVLVDAPVELTQLNARDELDPPSGVVGWYGPPQWSTTPGELSTYPGVLAGHTSYDGVADVFARLGEVRAGDVVTIRYADGEEMDFVADADALSVPKNDVTQNLDDYAWVWGLPEPGVTVSLFSCDPAEGLDLTGHSVNNWVVQATHP